jgi:hypothetical protein
VSQYEARSAGRTLHAGLRNYDAGCLTCQRLLYGPPCSRRSHFAPGKQIHVKVRSDHLERQVSVAKPILAVTELVWNALDADAKKVRVELGYNKMNGLQSITVIDNGHGLSYADGIPAFENLGGSWKSRRIFDQAVKRNHISFSDTKQG